ncbi:Copia protein [Phytophthora megakarya]|uniref:Copia protein n=1 Tax=Phytophthora megakarya TaxID=4795 RepID=A0A225WHW3_9STRA|nr:Copia protein [Phytophthora megakarya]
MVACGNEQEFGVNYGVTLAAVVEMSSVKPILALARRWRVHARHGDVPNAYVKADKEVVLEIYVRIPQGTLISDELKKFLGLLNKTLNIGFQHSLVDMYVYYRHQGAMDAFFCVLSSLSLANLRQAHRFRLDILSVIGLENANGVREPIGPEWNEEAGQTTDFAAHMITVDYIPIRWISNEQGDVALSTMEAEYTAASVVGQELLDVREFLGEMGLDCEEPFRLPVDNQATVLELEGE